MKLAVPFELRIFLVVVLVAIISVLVILDSPEPTAQITSRVVQGLQLPAEPTNTIIISGIDIGQAIGFKTPTLSAETNLACLADQRIVTNAGRATARSFLGLYDTVNGGCTVEFVETEEDKTGLFMRCRSSQKLFDLTIRMEPSFDSEIVDGELEDYNDESINIFGMPYTIIKTKITTSTNTLRIRFISPVGTLDIEDNYADTAFSEKVEVNGKRAKNGQVRIRGTVSGDEFMMHSIEYRLFPQPKIGKDVFVGDHQGTKQKLDVQESMLGDGDILFRGVRATQPRVSTPRPTITQRYGGNVIAFDVVGSDTIKMIFTNTRGQTYSFSRMTVEGGTLKSGDGDRDFIFEGAGASFNIDQGDLFAVSSGTGRNDVTNVLQYSSIDSAAGIIYFTDLAGDAVVGRFDTTTGDSTDPAIIGGESYIFRVDVSDAARPIRFDHNGDGSLGGEAIFIAGSGIQVNHGTTNSVITIPETLYVDELPSGGAESITVTFSEEDGDIETTVSGITLIKNDASGKREGINVYGAFVVQDNKNTANDVIIHLPGRQSGGMAQTPSYTTAGGQAQGEVLITCERSEFVKRAQEAKKKAS